MGLLGLLAIGASVSASARASESVQDLIDSAIANNPEVSASEARWSAFKARAAQAGRFEDPMLMLKIDNGMVGAPLDFRKDPSTAKVIGISQTVPFFGKRSLQKAAAGSEAESYRWLLEERKVELRRMVKESYFQLYAIDRALELADSNAQVLAQVVQIAQERYAAGAAPAQDVTKSELEKSRLLEARLELEQQRASAAAALNSLLSRDPESPLPSPVRPEVSPVGHTARELIELAGENRPLVKGYSALIRKAEANQRLARKENYPDVTVSAEYMQRSSSAMDRGEDMYSVGLTFKLPVQRERRKAIVQESSAEASMAHEEARALRNEISRSITSLIARVTQKERQLALSTSDLLPKSRQSLELASAEYRAGKVDLLALLEAQAGLLEAERNYYSSLAEYGMLKAQLEAAVGIAL